MVAKFGSRQDCLHGDVAMNHIDRKTPGARIIEHMWFKFCKDANENYLPKDSY